jgi:hypothetical protein
MHAPWIRDMEQSERNVSKGFRWIIAIILTGMVALIVFMLASCSHLTVAPKLVNPKSIAFDEENHQTAGVIDCGKDGCEVTAYWKSDYDRLEKQFSQSFPLNNKIEKLPNGHYQIPYLVYNHYVDMKSSERGP